MNRRALIKALGSVILLTGGTLPSVVFSQEKPKLLVPPEVTSPLFHVFGVLPEPVEIKRIFAAGVPASVLVNSVAPKQLLGWPFELPEASRLWLSDFSRQLPVVGRLAGRGSTISSEELLNLRPDIIIDAGEVNDHYLAQAQQFHEQTGIPYVLVGGRIEDTPEQVRVLGAILGHQRHGQQLATAAQEVLNSVAAKRNAFKDEMPSMYMARSATGLETGTGDSIHSEIIRLVGAKNVASDIEGERLGQVSMEQILLWDPDIVLTQDKAFYEGVYDNPMWQDLPAVRNKKVLFVPNVPFGWLDAPPSVNRLFGALWLLSWLNNEDQKVLIDELRHLFILYFAYDPGVERLQELLSDPAAFAA